ncbi:MAG: protein kinase domain-containing protein [Candidatus Promineifilaceae bacterium]
MQQLGKYELIKEIGRGAYATVWLGKHAFLQTEVAIKRLIPTIVNDDETSQRFIQEAQTASQLDEHDNIVQIEDLGTEDGQVFIVMEYLSGGTLKQWHQQNPNAAWQTFLPILKGAAAGLDAAHARKFWHRDVKPSNILLDENRVAHLGDFGLVRIADSPHMTKIGTAIGTPTYMSPEQARGRELDQYSDQYSLGIVAYELLTGRVPFDNESYPSVLAMHWKEPPPPPSQVHDAVPSEADSVLLRVLSKQPEDPQWSPDGIQVAYISENSKALYIINEAGQTHSERSSFWSYNRLEWSPDGTQIAAISYQFNYRYNKRLHIIKGQVSRELFLGDLGIDEMEWSPDGTQIAFASLDDLYTIDAEGKKLHQLIPDEPVHALQWSPDGEQIAFFTWNGLFIIDVDGENRKQLVAQNYWLYSLKWSPDGKQIAFVSGDEGDWDISITGLDTGMRRQVTDIGFSDILSYEWQPAD